MLIFNVNICVAEKRHVPAASRGKRYSGSGCFRRGRGTSSGLHGEMAARRPRHGASRRYIIKKYVCGQRNTLEILLV